MATASSIKVSVNGRKYQISGITKNTSCKDLLCALAKTTSCDRQLDLFEKWRDCERRLPLSAEPLGLLDCWGQEGAKVKFIARERGVAIKELESATTDKKRRSKRQPSKTKGPEHERRRKRSDKMRSVDDSDLDDYRRSRRLNRRSRELKKVRHYDDSDVDTYTELLRVVINQAQELKSQVKEIRKSDVDQTDRHGKPSKKAVGHKSRKVGADADADNDSGVPSIGDDSSQDSFCRDDSHNPETEKDSRPRIDSGLSSESTTPDIAVDIHTTDNCCNDHNSKGEILRATAGATSVVTTETHCQETIERHRLWLSYQDLCVQLCETMEELDASQSLIDSLACELTTLNDAESLENTQLDEEQSRLDKEIDVTKSLIQSVQSLTNYQNKEMSVNSTEVDEYEANIRTRRMLVDSLDNELHYSQLRTAPRRLLQRCKHSGSQLGKANGVAVDVVSLV